nr:MAG TPA: Portal protein [Caudoviricetes sp.]
MVAEENLQETEDMTWEEYMKELNNYARELKYQDAIQMREDLLDRTTDYFIKGMEQEKIDSLGGMEKATFSVKSVLKKLTVDTLKTADYGSYSPIFGEQLVNDLYPHSVPYTREKIRTLLKDAEKNSFEIRQAAEYVRNNILQFERAEQYFISLFAFKYYLLPKRTLSKFGDFKKSKEKVYKFLESLRIKEQFPRITADVIKNGCGFYLFSKKGDMFDFIRLPIDQCRITGVRSTFGMCFEVDAFYFEKLYQMGMVVPEIYDYYKDLIEEKMSPAERDKNGEIKRDKNGNIKRKQRRMGVNDRIFIPISPLHGCCITADPYKGTKVPLLAALLPDSLDILEYKNIQKQKSILETWCIIPQVIPYDSVEKPKVPLQLAKQTIALLQKSLPAGVVTFSTPLEVQNPITLQSSNTQENITGLGEQNFFSAVGIAGNVMGVGEAKNQAVLDFSNLTDFGFVSYIYNEFDTIVNLLIMIYVNENDWKVKFFGNAYRHDKEVKDASSMFSTNNLPAEYLGANLGFEPQEFEYMLEMGEKSKLKDMMTPLVSQFQQSGKSQDITINKKQTNSNSNSSSDGGRPQMDEDELSDSGQQAREDETNANREGM